MAEESDLMAKLARAKQPRLVYTYPVPESVSTEVTSIGLVELRIEEEDTAIQLGRGNTRRQAAELAKAALREVNGKPVSTGDASADAAWNSFGSKLRTMVEIAFNKIHLPEDKELADFLGGQQVRTS